MKMQMKRTPTQVMLCQCCCTHATHSGGYFLRTNFSPPTKIGISKRRLEFEDCICFHRNPIQSKLLGRIAAETQQQQRTNQIDRRLSQFSARKTGVFF